MALQRVTPTCYATHVQQGVNLPNMADPATLVDLAVTAEAAGWDGVFLWDHVTYFPWTDALPLADPWVVLGAIAQATTRVRLGTMVTPMARRRPWHVAKEVATLDHLSGGRAVLSVGLGDPVEGDFAAFGEPTGVAARAALLDEGLEIVDALWSGGRVDHDGAHFNVHATMRPAPLQRPRPPVWVGGMWPNPGPFERAARWDGVVPLLVDPTGIGLCQPDDIRAIVEFVRRHRTTDVPFDVITSAHWDHEPAAYADAGLTWLIQSWNAEPTWVDELRPIIERGPAPL